MHQIILFVYEEETPEDALNQVLLDLSEGALRGIYDWYQSPLHRFWLPEGYYRIELNDDIWAVYSGKEHTGHAIGLLRRFFKVQTEEYFEEFHKFLMALKQIPFLETNKNVLDALSQPNIPHLSGGQKYQLIETIYKQLDIRISIDKLNPYFSTAIRIYFDGDAVILHEKLEDLIKNIDNLFVVPVDVHL